MEDGGDYGGSEDEPDEGDAFEEPIEVADHGSSRQMMSRELSAGEGLSFSGLWYRTGCFGDGRAAGGVLTRSGAGNILRGEEGDWKLRAIQKSAGARQVADLKFVHC